MVEERRGDGEEEDVNVHVVDGASDLVWLKC